VKLISSRELDDHQTGLPAAVPILRSSVASTDPPLITYAEALNLLRLRVTPLPIERVPTKQSGRRILATDVLSPADLPSFDNSAMDGIALRCGTGLVSAGSELMITGLLAAGEPAPSDGNGAWQIMTGAALPLGCDAVIPIERVEVLARNQQGAITRVRLRADVKPGMNVRRAGSDIAAGDRALAAGARIDPAQQMICAALGLAELPLWKRAKVSLLQTGKELVDDPQQDLCKGQIRDCNGPYLENVLGNAGAEVIDSRHLGDDSRAYEEAVRQALTIGTDVIVSTGAVSMGELDFIPATLRRLGAEIVFHKVGIRPGKPVLFAVLPGGPLYFGLPGNPLAAAVGARFIIDPALRAMAGRGPEKYPRLPLAHATRKKPGMRSFLKARVHLDSSGQASVELLPGQESFRIRPLLSANAWAILGEEADSCEQGEIVEVAGLYGALLEG